jgi:hypothetical protein
MQTGVGAIITLYDGYLFQIKANQADTLEALVACLRNAHLRSPAAETVEKRGGPV